MIEVREADGVAHLTIEGRLTAEDMERALPRVDALLQERDSMPFYIDLRDLSDVDPQAVWQDVAFDAVHKDRYGRTAVVGDRRWQQWATELSDRLLGAPMRFFEPAEEGQAWHWVSGGPGAL